MKTIIIAEAGVNHNGDITMAKKLINAAAIAGADYVKFQTFVPEKLASSKAKLAAYQKENTQESSQLTMLRKLVLSQEQHIQLKLYALDKGIKFLSTGFDEGSVDFLDNLEMDFFKIPSGEITNLPYLKHIAEKSKPVILSTGMANLQEIEDALNVLESNGKARKDITVLHCNTQYPTSPEDVNLLAMETIRVACGVKVGYSDHTLGILVPLLAVAMGACVIEKHFTLDNTLPGPDHKASLEPEELKEMVEQIRLCELILGNSTKHPTPSEQENSKIVRKSIHFSKTLKKGHVIQHSDFQMLRPGTGVSPMRLEELIGKTLIVDVTEGVIFNWEQVS